MIVVVRLALVVVGVVVVVAIVAFVAATAVVGDRAAVGRRPPARSAEVVAATLWAVRQRRSSARREQEADVGEPSGSAKLHVTPESLLPGEQKEVGATRRNKPRREQQAQSRGGWGAAGG